MRGAHIQLLTPVASKAWIARLLHHDDHASLRACAGTGAEQDAAALQALTPPAQQQQQQDGAKVGMCRWQKLAEGEGLELVHQHSVSNVTWHARGDYFASVAPTGNTQVELATLLTVLGTELFCMDMHIAGVHAPAVDPL